MTGAAKLVAAREWLDASECPCGYCELGRFHVNALADEVERQKRLLDEFVYNEENPPEGGWLSAKEIDTLSAKVRELEEDLDRGVEIISALLISKRELTPTERAYGLKLTAHAKPTEEARDE